MKKAVSRICGKMQIIRTVFVTAWVIIGANAGPLYSQSGAIRINEFMALNQTTIADADGDYSDWIELYNTTANSVNLSGWSLTDEIGLPQKWMIPDVTLSANGYLLLFASGKDRNNAAAELHTNFKLSGTGEYLALLDRDANIVKEFSPNFPEQNTDISFGYYDNDYIAFITPTPGAANDLTAHQLLTPPVFSMSRGFYEKLFLVELTSDLLNAKIVYTTDGSVPGETNGTEYTAPLNVNTTTVLRAITLKSGGLSSRVTTQTYLFLKDVITQGNSPVGYPAMWGPYFSGGGYAIADYEMDPQITQDPIYSALMEESLLSIPTMSIVTDKDNFFSASTDSLEGGIYIYTGPPIDHYEDGLGIGWERPASVEFFKSDSKEEFQVDCGVRIQGGHSRRPEKSPKHSLRLCFRSEYGPSKLEYPLFGEDGASAFNTLILRAGFCNSWIHSSESQRGYAQYIRDSWAKDTQKEMGHLSGRGIFVHLYINGIYWGLYNPTERMDGDFAESYLEGNKEDFDIVKDYQKIVDGNIDTWQAMMNMARSDLSDNAAYQRIQGNNPDGTPNPDYEPYVDVVNFIDYMILNFYGGNTDWDSHNWAAVRNRVHPDKGFKFLIWDAEHILESLSHNSLGVNNGYCPSDLFQKLRNNAEFRQLFSDRVQYHCFNGGVLTPESIKERWMRRANEIDLAIIAESARWGDYRRDVHSKGSVLYTKNDHWLVEQNRLMNSYFPERTSNFISKLRSSGLFPSANVPVLEINDEVIAPHPIIRVGDQLTMTVSSGEIYYTADGTDPNTNATISPSAVKYSEPISMTESMMIKARTLNNNQWSALQSAALIIPENLKNLKITEIHYHPISEAEVDDRVFEFIELKNIGSTTLNISGVNFCNGISYTFTVGTKVNPGSFIILASDKVHFKSRYGFEPFDEYEGYLNNAGERIVLIDAVEDTLFSLRYNDKDPWPVAADGEGYSLVSIGQNPENSQSDPSDWRASHERHGSPGADDLSSAVNNESQNILPMNFIVEQNYPNPFNNCTMIEYRLPVKTNVSIKVYDMIGRTVKTLYHGSQLAGDYRMLWDGCDNNDDLVTSGVYFYRLRIEEDNTTKTISKKMILLK